MTTAINRRQALAAIGTVSLTGLLAACGDGDGGSAATEVTTTDGATAAVEPRTRTDAELAKLFDESATCAVTPEMTEGPYYFDADKVRTDIREDREGVPLTLGIRVRDAGKCEPIRDAIVDVWHCDALGNYSGFEAASTGGGPGGGPGGGGGPTDSERYLRGAQITNSDGIARFVTVYPGWYQGRTVHIHAKVHLDARTVLTSQLFFDEGVTEPVYEQAPYSERTGRDTFNDTDGIFDERLVMTVKEDGDGRLGLITFDAEAA